MMKKLFTTFALVAGLLFAGCTSLGPVQIETVAVVLTQTADQGAVYAIQKDHNNAQYFKIADATLDTFVTGTDLTPTSLQNALSKVTGTNQWVNLAVSAVVVAYDVSYKQYVVGKVNSNAVAVAWITAVETGFKQALAETGTDALRAGKKVTPYFLTVDGKLDKAAVESKVKAAAQ